MVYNKGCFGGYILNEMAVFVEVEVWNLKKGLMTQFPYARGRAFVCKNIGDYVQAVATRQFVNPINEYIEQEEANNYYPEDKEKIRLIMNGWFQWRAENWPPSEYIDPLLISMHISPLKAESLLTREGIEFLKKHAPVGCRDLYTKKLLESKGIPAYFSACMTLTLGEKYTVPPAEHKGVFFVDPYFEIPDIISEIEGKKAIHFGNAVKGAAIMLAHIPSVLKLGKKDFFKVYSPTGFLDRNKSVLRPYYKAALFYSTYKKKFSRELLLNASYITHWMDVDMSGKVTNDDLLDIAEGLIMKYASAKMVVTSRIHAGLPCLGVGTPVVFIANNQVLSDNGTFNTPGRLGGLLDLFRLMTLENGHFRTEDEVFRGIDRFTQNTAFENKTNWKPYAQDLKKKAEEFMME